MLIKNLFEKKQKLAFLTALLFAIHPIHAEAVSWVSGRPEILALFFGLLSFLFFIKKNWAFSNLFFLLSLFSKETGIVLLPIFFFYTILFKKKKAFSLNNLFLQSITLFIYFSFRWLALGNSILSNDATLIENPLKFTSSTERILTALKITTIYFSKLVFPLKLSADYSFNQIPIVFSFWQPEVIIGLLILSISAISIFLKPLNKVVRFGSVLFIFPFLLISNLIIPIGTIMGERLMYFPSLGFCLILAYFILRLIPARFYPNILIAIIIALFSLRTFLRNFDWKNEFVLYQSMARVSSNSVLSRSNLGAIYVLKKDWDRAKEELLIANQIYDKYPHAINNLGLIYQHEKDFKRAEEQFKKAINVNPDYQLAYQNLGILYFNQEEYKKAKQQFEKILPGNEENPQLIYWLNQVNTKLKETP